MNVAISSTSKVMNINQKKQITLKQTTQFREKISLFNIAVHFYEGIKLMKHTALKKWILPTESRISFKKAIQYAGTRAGSS